MQPQLDATARRFVDDVLALDPKLAVFDCDGTLWAGDTGSGFMYWAIETGLYAPKTAEWMRVRYAAYKAGQVDEYTICAEMTQVHKGLSEAALRASIEAYLDSYLPTHLFPEMQVLTHELTARGCELWAVSSTFDRVVACGVERYGIDKQRVLGASVAFDGDLATDCIVRVPTDELKATAIVECIGRVSDATFGNSMHDYAMMQTARAAFAVNPNPDLAIEAEKRGWRLHKPVLVVEK